MRVYLGIVTLLMIAAPLSFAQTGTLSVTLLVNNSSGTSQAHQKGDNLTLDAQVTGATANTSVSFYYNNGAVLLGTVTSGTAAGNVTNYYFYLNDIQIPYSNITAEAQNGGAAASSTTLNGVIDMVGSPDFLAGGAYVPTTPNTPYPYKNTNFGTPGTSTTAYTNTYNGTYDSTTYSGTYNIPDSTTPPTPWNEADNQMCLTTWPYNGNSANFPDGTCEWTNSASQPAFAMPGDPVTGSVPSAPIPIVNCPPGDTKCSTVDSLDDTMHTLSDFVTWANGILSKNLGILSSSFDTWYPSAEAWIAPECPATPTIGNGIDFFNGGAPCDLTTDPNCTPTSYSCNTGSPGRLLNIYNPNVSPPVDELQVWNGIITAWLNNTYTPANSTSYTVAGAPTPALWCVPTESTGGLEVTEKVNGTEETIPTTEDTYIRTNATTATWGDLPHVIACLNYNAGPTPATTIPNASNYQACLSALTSGSTCPTTLPNACASSILGYPSSVTPPAFNGGTGTGCDVYEAGSYANWVSNNINFGPVYNYQNCLNLLANKCPVSLSGTVCDPAVLGRSLMPPYPGTYTGGYTNGTPSSSCDPNYTDASGQISYAQWVNDSMTLFQYENSKFALRSTFLTDIYNRAKTLQNITAQADTALHNFLKPCEYTSSCVDGGPAAQLMWARSQGDPTTVLPNSVIYGWVDSMPVGSGGCTDSNGHKVGCAHIVKATAYSPGRSGNPSISGDNAGAFVQSLLPWINSFTSWTVWMNLGSLIPTPVPIPWLDDVLESRDGYVYVSIKRWDQDHTNAVTFPNKHMLWQSMFHRPAAASLGAGLPSACTISQPTAGGMAGIGWGLELQTQQGLETLMDPQDTNTAPALGNAFMLNDNGNGQVDTTNLIAGSGSDVCGNGSPNGAYCECLGKANALLNTGTESHSCAEYIASRDASKSSPAIEQPPSVCWGWIGPPLNSSCNPPTYSSSPNAESDYSLKFVNCQDVPGFPKNAPPPEDMTYVSSD